MLLRRIAEHLKVQNWTAVLLDFLIVVVGVYIGIQAANWNDERRAREERATSLDRLHSEAEMSVAFLHAVVEQYRRTIEARSSVLSRAAEGEIDAVEQEQMVLAINYLPFYPAVAPPRGVYDEIISAGQFRHLGDAGVRAAITRYYFQLESLNSFMSYARGMSEHMSVWRHPAVRKEFDPADFTTQTHTVVDTDMALEDQNFVKTLQIGHGMQVLSMRQWETTLADAELMCDKIAEYLGRNCISTESEHAAVDGE